MFFIDIALFYLGALMTSFYLLLGNRLIKKQTILGHSYCDHCKHDLSLIEVLPLIGYLIQLGKCRYCKVKISFKYPLVELFGGLMVLIGYQIYGFHSEFYVLMILYFVFLITIVTDVQEMLVFDRIWLIGALLVIIVRIGDGNLLEYLISSVSLFMILYAISLVSSKIYQKEALGGGDVKLYLFIGLTLSFLQGLLSLFIASFVALIYVVLTKRSKEAYLPLVPFLFIGVTVSFLYGKEWITWYLSLLGA